jgi:hypothetical protein
MWENVFGNSNKAGLIFNVNKEVGARLWSQLIQRKKWKQKFGESGDLKYAIYTSIFQMSFRCLIYEFIKEKLHYMKLCAAGYHKCWQTSKKEKRMAIAVTIWLCNHKRGKEVFEPHCHCDETWIAYITPESKLQFLQWRHTGSPKPKNCSRFWRRKLWLLSSGKVKA